jgi:predicted nucleic acid-binding protein
MFTILLDADASIKLTKISIIEILASGFEIILTSVVYDEQVNAGLKRNYEDAAKMEKLVADKKVAVVDVTEKSSIDESFRLGRGEKSVINYCLTNDVDMIVSDDEAFLKILDNYEVPFTPVAGTILMCIIHGLVNKEKGLKYLESLKPIIRDEHMFYIKSKIEDLG